MVASAPRGFVEFLYLDIYPDTLPGSQSASHTQEIWMTDIYRSLAVNITLEPWTTYSPYSEITQHSLLLASQHLYR
jgi:hypothetical protein